MASTTDEIVKAIEATSPLFRMSNRSTELMAQRDELLAALRAVLAEIEYLVEDGTLLRADVDATEAHQRARAAIAKAEGRS